MAVDHSTSFSDAETGPSLRRLYTPAMLAELLAVPVAAIRRWHRQGTLQVAECVGRLPYFHFEEVTVARRLAELHRAGCSLRTIDRRLAELEKLMPGVERPFADPAVVVEGRRMYIRRGDDLSEPWGQLLLEFDPSAEEDDADKSCGVIPMVASPLNRRQVAASCTLIEQLQQAALDWEDEGQLDRAAESYRTLLMAAGPQAEIQFALADVLYRAGDLSAARERYYAALELDEEYLEARANLGCLLAETGELELAAATFEGALNYHPDFADVHFHLAGALQRLDRADEAAAHLRTFLELAPESPWAAAARDRLAESHVWAD